MQLLDWLVVLLPVLVILVVAVRTRRHVRSVADFMAGGRVAGRYLVAVADGMAVVGLISMIALFERDFKSGFTLMFWHNMVIPVGLVLTLTGFVIYRFRETRALTLAQFFEARYSRRFRIFAGVLGALSGLINYGLFPAVSSQFFVYYCHLPESLDIAGLEIPTFAILMACFLTVACAITLSGGQLTIMVVDYLQGIFMFICCIVFVLLALNYIGWDRIAFALSNRPQGESLINPFDSHSLEDFNLTFVLISAFGTVYCVMAWQGAQGFNCAAHSPHEAKMGKMLGTWRSTVLMLAMCVLSISAFTLFNHPDFGSTAATVQDQLSRIENPAVQNQQRVPLALSHIFPIGISGAFLAVMAFLMVSTDTTYLHSWGSIVIQDIVLPFRNRPFAPMQHLRLLRFSIVGVALFAFTFSLVFKQTTYILMFFALTGSIYLGGAGACIIGGLYWRRGTAAGAWSAMITGATVALLGFTLTNGWGYLHPWLTNLFPDSQFLASHEKKFPINGQVMWFIAMLGGIGTYVVVSLLTCRKPFNLERMLHREDLDPSRKVARTTFVGAIKTILPTITSEFNFRDKVLAWAVFCWSMLLFGTWATATIWNMVSPWTNSTWATYFLVTGIIIPLIVGVITTVVFLVGGTGDLRRMFKLLREMPRDATDDGRVNHPNGCAESPELQTLDSPVLADASTVPLETAVKR